MITKVVGGIMMAVIVLAVPVSLISYVWTKDLRWIASAMIFAACIAVIWKMGEPVEKKDSE